MAFAGEPLIDWGGRGILLTGSSPFHRRSPNMIERRQFLSTLATATVALVASAGAAPRRNKKRNQKRPLTKRGHAAELPTVDWVRGKSFKVGRKTYILSTFGKVIINGEEGALSDLRPGMQAMVTSSLLETGETTADSIYKATRVVARQDNKLEKKAREADRKLREKLKKANSRRRSRRRRN